MFKNIARTLQHIALSVASSHPQLSHLKAEVSKQDTAALNRALGGRGKPSGAAQLKRAATKRNNIRKHN